MRLPEAVVAMGVTGEFPVGGPLLRHHQPDRPGHAPAAGPEHGAHRALGDRPHRAGDPRLLRQAGQADPVRAPLGAAPCLRAVRGRRVGAGRGTGARVLSGGTQYRSRCAAQGAHRPQRPRRDLAPGVFDRRGQRVRSAVRGCLRLLREDAAQRGHPDPRGRAPGRWRSTSSTPIRSASPTRCSSSSAPCARRRCATTCSPPSWPSRSPASRAARCTCTRASSTRRPAATSSATKTAAPSAEFHWYIGGLQKYVPAAMALFAPYVNRIGGWCGRMRAHQHPVGHRQPDGGHPRAGGHARGAARREPGHRCRRQPLRGAGGDARLRLPRHQEPDRTHARMPGRRLPGRLPAATQPGRGAAPAARRDTPWPTSSAAAS